MAIPKGNGAGAGHGTATGPALQPPRDGGENQGGGQRNHAGAPGPGLWWEEGPAPERSYGLQGISHRPSEPEHVWECLEDAAFELRWPRTLATSGWAPVALVGKPRSGPPLPAFLHSENKRAS